MALRVNTFKSVTDFTEYYRNGVTLQCGELKYWLNRKGFTQKYVAERLGMSKRELCQKLFNRHRFSETEITMLIKILGAKAAISIIWFPTLQEKKKVKKYVWEGQMSNKNNTDFVNSFETSAEKKARRIQEQECEYFGYGKSFEQLIFNTNELPSRKFYRSKNNG